jgi:hypothetical protein
MVCELEFGDAVKRGGLIGLIDPAPKQPTDAELY